MVPGYWHCGVSINYDGIGPVSGGHVQKGKSISNIAESIYEYLLDRVCFIVKESEGVFTAKTISVLPTFFLRVFPWAWAESIIFPLHSKSCKTAPHNSRVTH